MDGGGDSMPTTVAGSGVPNEAALLALMEKSGYQMLQENGQRKYGGPPPSWEGPAPLRGCEIFIGKIPRDCYEDELVPVFEKVGKIYELRLMMDFSGSNRGYAFVMYTNKADAVKAVKELNNYEIRKGRLLGVCLSVDNCRLFVGGIPKNKQKDEIHTEMDKVTEGVVDVIVYPSAQDKSKNRGFAFVEYESHRSAAMARRKLIPGRIQLWGHQIAVDWAEPEQEVDEEVMKNVKILYVRNLMLTTTEETLEEVFTKAAGNDGCVERVKKIRDYAFVHFRERQDAITAMHQLNGQLVDNARVEVCLAKPVDKTDYVRYTRGGHAPQFQQGYAGGFEAVPFTGGAPQYYGQFGNMPVGRGFTPAARGGMRPPMMRGRGRGAAGSRAAGGRGGYTHTGFRGKHPAEDRLFNIRPGMKLTPTDPITLKPQSMKSPVQTLEEFCTKNGMGSPVYQLHSAIDRESNGDVQLFLYKVAIPALASTYPNSAIQPPQLCRSVEEAKVYAAEFALGQLGVPMEGNITDVAISPPPGPGVIPASTLGVTSQLTSPTSPLASSTLASSMYQGRPLVPGLPGTGYSLTNATRNDFTFAPSLPVSSYVNVMAPGKIPQNMTSPVAESPPAQYLYSDCMLSPSLGNEMSPSYYGYLASPSVNTALAFNFSHLVTTH